MISQVVVYGMKLRYNISLAAQAYSFAVTSEIEIDPAKNEQKTNNSSLKKNQILNQRNRKN